MDLMHLLLLLDQFYLLGPSSPHLRLDLMHLLLLLGP